MTYLKYKSNHIWIKYKNFVGVLYACASITSTFSSYSKGNLNCQYVNTMSYHVITFYTWLTWCSGNDATAAATWRLEVAFRNLATLIVRILLHETTIRQSVVMRAAVLKSRKHSWLINVTDNNVFIIFLFWDNFHPFL